MNNTQLIMIAKKLYPNKTVYDLTKEEQSKVLDIYYDYN
jgi:hypothetical protein